jgi:hypothetical protein
MNGNGDEIGKTDFDFRDVEFAFLKRKIKNGGDLEMELGAIAIEGMENLGIGGRGETLEMEMRKEEGIGGKPIGEGGGIEGGKGER